MPSYNGKEWSLEDWEKLYGSTEATTDVGGVFAPQLIKTYPVSKVVLTIRDFDQWYKSLDESLLYLMWNDPLEWFLKDYVLRWRGIRLTLPVSKKLILGLFQAKGVDDVRKNACRVYDEHHRMIQEMVPADRLLIYKLGDGWEPLCEFLGKPVPDVEYPRTNDKEWLRSRGESLRRDTYIKASKLLLSWAVSAGAVAVGLVFAWKRAKGLA
ncbi:hypothetical protein PT974_10701 [Cladobotryum mycophilum]|uniref:NAD dependent epimerase/dehydratase n=1 Tax=Cladobotryum mycophilum TaxID=491253 RepID=A0ABR0SAM3_9HYPO